MNKLGNSRILLSSTTRHIVGRCNAPSHHRYQPTLLPRHLSGRPSWKSHLQTAGQFQARSISFEQQAKDLNQKGVDKQLHDYDAKIAEDEEKSRKAPWHREGSDKAPVHTQREAGAMTKGEIACAYTIGINIHGSRKTTHHSFSTTEARSTSKYSRHKQRQERCRSPCLAGPSQPASFLFDAPDTIRATLDQDK